MAEAITSTPRIERKIVLDWHPDQVQKWLETHELCWTRQFPDRQVYTQYLDTPELDAYKAWQEGDPQRVKWRLRWYLDSLGEMSVVQVEQKRRNGLRIHKTVVATGVQASGLTTLLTHPLIPPTQLGPTVTGCYLRSYMQSPKAPVRVTIDRQLSFCTIQDEKFIAGAMPFGKTLLEIKYSVSDATEVEAELGSLPGRVSRFSKYAFLLHQKCLVPV